MVWATVACGGTAPLQLTVDSSTRYQTVDGFGTALASLSPTWTPQMQSAYAQDLGASMLRTILTPDVLPGQVTLGPDVQTNVNLFNFNTSQEGPWGQFAQAVNAQRIDQMKVIGTVFSPPPWMKTNNNINKGSLIQTPDNLQQFARYLAAYVTGFQQTYHVPLYAVSIQNELRFAQPYPSAVYNPQQYAATVKAVGQEFAKDGITTQIFGPEDVGVDSGFLTKNQLSFINAVKADPQAAPYLNIYAVHGYTGNGSTPSSQRGNWSDYASKVSPDHKQSWMTEESGENPAWIHSDPTTHQPDGALSVALHVHDGLAYGNLNAWVYWQFDDGKYPNSNFTLTSNSDTSILKFNAFKHYARYVRPGDVRVNAGPDNATGVNIDAFADDANHLLTINLINMAATASPVTVAIPGTDFSSFAQYRTSATEPWAVLGDVPVINGSVSLTLPPQSIVTLESDGIGGALPEPSVLGIALPALVVLRRHRK